jgi:hypothetical protein
MGKNFLIKTSMGKPPNEMGNCPFASPLVAPLYPVKRQSFKTRIFARNYQNLRLVGKFF